MSKKQSILQGTFILTTAAILSRIMGFFYRIFLSRSFGAENVGLYQLIFPVFGLCAALSCSGIETAISRTVAHKMSLNKQKEAKDVLILGLILSVSISVILMLLIQRNANEIAVLFLKDSRCEPLLIIISYILPFTSIHSCICGFCYGLHQAKIPAISQLIEQFVRIASVYALYLFAANHKLIPGISIAAAGLVIGEFAASVYSANAVAGMSFHENSSQHHEAFPGLKELIFLSLPITANRVSTRILQSIEAISIPNQLKSHHDTAEALSIYGTLTGMALPLILFPSAVTSSISIMLMPTVAELQAANKPARIRSVIQKSVGSCTLLGIISGLFFITAGPYLGRFLFQNKMAGDFISTLGWICPFLYSNGALGSVMNGLGKTSVTFWINSIGLCIRIACIYLIIPQMGIQGYLYGMLFSQLCVSLLYFLKLKKVFHAPL